MDRFKQYLQEHVDDLDTDLPRDKVWQHIQQQVSAPQSKKGLIRPLYLRWAAAACLAGLLILSAWWLLPSRARHQTGHFTAETHGAGTHQNAPSVNTENRSATASRESEPVAEPAKKREPKAISNDNNQAFASGTDREKNNNAPDSEIKESYEPSPLQHMEAGFIHIINTQLKQIRATPLYAENADYFSTFKKQFYQLNEDERAWKKRVGRGQVTEEQLDELISIYEQKLKVLRLLQAEIIKTNKHYKQTGTAVSVHNSYMDI